MKSQWNFTLFTLVSTVLSFIYIVNLAVLPNVIEKRGTNVLLDECGSPVNNPGSKIDKTEEFTVKKRSFCSDEHRFAVEYCSSDNKNIVLHRNKHITPNSQWQWLMRWGELRPYSMLSSSPQIKAKPPCKSIENYLDAIRLGSREWPNYDYGNRAITPSIFAPLGCYAPTIPPPSSRICNTLGQYGHVVLSGDSIMRHIKQGMFMALTRDYVEGAMMMSANDVRGVCSCDGQFSEHSLCRSHQKWFESTIRITDIPYQQKLCENVTTSFMFNSEIEWEKIQCEDISYRGVLLVLQGGLHFNMNSTLTFLSVIKPVITHPKFIECACYGKLRFIWISMHSQTKEMDAIWPHQSGENAIEFNENIHQSFIDAGLVPGQDVLVLDWWNMTKDAQSSDGLHSLSDVNLAKVAQILYLAEKWPFHRPGKICLEAA